VPHFSSLLTAAALPVHRRSSSVAGLGVVVQGHALRHALGSDFASSFSLSLSLSLFLELSRCRSPAWSPAEGSHVWRNPTNSDEVLPDQVQDEGKNHICNWFGHLTEFFTAFLASVSSLQPLLKG
jgi:hypothetical protein